GGRAGAPCPPMWDPAGARPPPPPLFDQLKVGGRMVIPEGEREEQMLVVYDKTPQGLTRTAVEPASFVPLIGRHGWRPEGS
ncbi:MAG: protein-L-isoaspartate O-methyltransferase, partial [Acidobacteriota bacterium]